MKLFDTAQLLLGSVVLVAGLGISTVAAHAESFLGVFLGFALFVVGYKISQTAVRQAEESELQGTVEDVVEGAGPVELFMTIVGVGAIAYGFTLLFDSFSSSDFVLTLTASAFMFGGYVTAHYGVNRTVV